MSLLTIACVCGLLCGFLLMGRVPLCASAYDKQEPENATEKGSFAVLIPVRNEEQNLPRLLASISSQPQLAEVIVIDDNSTDRTAEIAAAFHARVLQSGEPDQNVTGKAWACAYGAEHCSTDNLLFLDADTFFEPKGFERLLKTFEKLPVSTVLSVLPFAVTERPYEELSLFFNLLMAFGAGGFGVFQPRLFGQSLMIDGKLYQALGGHASVRKFVLENFHLSRALQSANARSLCLGGRGTLRMRMFPEGFTQLRNGWVKAFADGAASTDLRVLLFTVLWMSSLATIAFVLPFMPHISAATVLALYLFAVMQVYFFARQIGSFRLYTCVLFSVPLLAFFLFFAHSTMRRIAGRTTNWRGRAV